MKKLFVLFCALFTLQFSYAQQLGDTISISYLDLINSRSLSTDQGVLDYGKTYVLLIKDINRQLYSINDSTKQKSFNTKRPEVFSSLSLPTYAIFGALGPTKGEEIQEALVDNNNINNNTDLLSTFRNADSLIKKAQILELDLLQLLETSGQKYDSIFSKSNDLVRTFSGTTEEGKAKLVISLEEFLINNFEQIERVNKIIQATKIQVLESLYQEMEEPNKVITIWKNYAPKRADSSRYERELNELIVQQKELATLQREEKELKGLFELYAARAKAISELRKGGFIQRLLKTYSRINPSNFTYYGKPIKVKGDKVNFKFDIKAKEALANDLPMESYISRNYDVKGGLKVDFSTGVFVNMGNDDFLGRELVYTTNADSSVNIEAKNGGSRALLSIGGLMHLYGRNTSKSFRLAVSPGLSTSANFDELNFHLGVSGIFGKKERFILTLGTTLREALILDKNYSYDQSYKMEELPAEPPGIKVFPRAGFFMSLTYNLSKIKGT